MSTDGRPISELVAGRGLWFVCHHPSRPVDPLVRWHYGWCATCGSRAAALAEAYPDDPHVRWLAAQFPAPSSEESPTP